MKYYGAFVGQFAESVIGIDESLAIRGMRGAAPPRPPLLAIGFEGSLLCQQNVVVHSFKISLSINPEKRASSNSCIQVATKLQNSLEIISGIAEAQSLDKPRP